MFAFLGLLSCSNNFQTERGFGKLRLGMTKNEILNTFPETKPRKIETFSDLTADVEYDSIRISKKIILKNAFLSFRHAKLHNITVDCDRKLFEILQSQNGIKDTVTYNNGAKRIDFLSNMVNVRCGYESYNGHAAIIFIDLGTK
jgi:hypothetical protein